MLINHFKSAWRNLIQNPFSSLINIAGLATGITCCVFIALYVWSEFNADSFNVNKNDIVRVNQIGVENGRASQLTSYPLGTSVQNEYPSIRKIVRVGQDNVSIRADKNSYFYEAGFYYADSTFFDVFTCKIIKGDQATPLKNPYSLVITESIARKYFNETDPIGKVVDMKVYDGDRKFTLTITAVVADPPKNAAVQFDLIAPMHLAMSVYPKFENLWGLSWVTTYAQIDHSSPLPTTAQQSDAFFKKYTGQSTTGNVLEFQPLERVHLYSGHVGRNSADGITNVYIFSTIGVLIFLLACVNFINISTARAELRKKEVGVRKALGAFRIQLFSQFMTEAMLVAGIVMIISITATTALYPFASEYIGKSTPVFSAVLVPLFFILSLIVIGLFAGLYPAVFLSGFKPLEALKGKPERLNGIANNARQVLVVFQFTISIGLIAGTLMISKQVHYLKEADLGFANDQLITIPIDDRAQQQKIKTIKEMMATAPGVSAITATGEKFPAEMNNTSAITWQGLAPDDHRVADIVSIDEDYFPMLKATFIEGRNLSKKFGSDDSSAIIINEAARAMIGSDALGKEINVDGRKGTVIGIVKDIHHFSLHQKVTPITYFPVPAGSRACSDNLVLRISPSRLPETLSSLKQKWEILTQDRPFEFHFVDAEFAKAYEQEETFLSLFGIFSALAIIIACLGLMGLSSFVVNRRSKEIGIRKVLGASVGRIVLMLTQVFSLPIGVAFLIAGPAVYFIISGWLSKFAYKIDVDLVLIALAGVAAWSIAFLFVGIQSWKAARINPTQILKNE